MIYVCRHHEGEDVWWSGEEGGARREGRAERIFSTDPWLLQSRKDAFSTEFVLSPVGDECLRRGREGQKAPISVAQERQILDVPTLIPGPCAAAPKTGGAA